MSRFKRALDKTGTSLINGINAGNPEHQPIDNLGLDRSKPVSPRDDVETLSRLTMGTGSVIVAGTLAVETIAQISHEAVTIGLGVGLGGIAVGAAIYGIGKITEH